MTLAFLILSPLLFGIGAACVSIPIIIHLLNKRKFRTVVWAAMAFLLAAQRRNARKLKFRRWLLLACRCLALLLLAAGIGRLLLQGSSFASIFSSGQRAYVVLWDDSYSMAYARPPTASAFERSKKALRDWLGTLDPTDEVLVLRTSRLSVRNQSGLKPTRDHAALAAQVAAARVTDASTDLPAAFDQAAAALKALEGTASSRELLVLTDCTRSAIHDPAKGVVSALGGAAAENLSGDRLKRAVAGAKAHATGVRLVDFGVEDQTNTAVTALESERPVVVAGGSANFSVTVENATDHPEVDTPLTILLDGVRIRTEKLARIDAGSPRTVTVSVPLATAGRHALEARLAQPDLLPLDDSRTLILNVRREIPVLLVDGDPGDEGRTSYGSTVFLQAAYGLSVGDKAAAGAVFAPRVITELELPSTPLPQYSVVVLSDTSAPRSAGLRSALKKYVENGGLLIIFPGAHTNGPDMNAFLGTGSPEGAGILPATIGQHIEVKGAGDLASGAVFAPQGFTHPVLQPFGEAYKSGMQVGLTSVQTREYLKLSPPADGSSEVILRYADATGAPGDPAVVMKTVGGAGSGGAAATEPARDAPAGRVVLFASTADNAWNTFGAKPSFLPFIQLLTYYALPRETDALTLRPGEKIHMTVGSTAIAAPAPGAWNGPGNTTVSVVSEIGKDGRQHLESGPLKLAGPYIPSGSATGRPVVYVNPDAEEADIRHVGAAEMAGALGIDAAQVTRVPELGATAGSKGAGAGDTAPSLFPLLLIGCALAVFGAETLFATLFSRYR